MVRMELMKSFLMIGSKELILIGSDNRELHTHLEYIVISIHKILINMMRKNLG